MTSRQITIAGFVALGLGGLALQALGRRATTPVPTFGELVGSLMRSSPLRLAILFAWWWIGWQFFTR
jgi:hypothetical protein